MARDVWQKTITSLSGNVLDGAQITVRNQQTNALADVFDSQSGGSQRPNPFLTGADGVARFFAEPGFYKVTAFKDGFGTAEFIWNNLGDNNLRVEVKSAAFADILGTVSQSGGVPTGAIIQRGSNANGEFVRYADGTLICFKLLSIPSASEAIGSIFRTSTADRQTWSYPSGFSAMPTVNVSAGDDGASQSAGWATVVSKSISSAAIGRLSATSNAAAQNVNLIAIGRWF